MGSSRQVRSYSWLGEASHFFYILCFHRQKDTTITIIEKKFHLCVIFKKKATTLQNVSQNRWFSHTNAHHGARKHQNIHSTVYTCRFRTIVETEAKQRQIETFLLIVVNLFGPFWKIFLTLYGKTEVGFRQERDCNHARICRIKPQDLHEPTLEYNKNKEFRRPKPHDNG